MYKGLTRSSGVTDRGPCFRDNSLGDHFGDRLRLGDIRGEFLGDDHGDRCGESRGDLERGDTLLGDILGDLKRDDPLRGDSPGDLDFGDNLRPGDCRRGDSLGEFDLKGDLGCDDILGGENFGVLDRASLGDLIDDVFGDFERDNILGDLELCRLGDLECGRGDLPRGDNFRRGDLLIGDLCGDSLGDRSRGDNLGDRDRGEYRGGDFRGDLYLGSSL